MWILYALFALGVVMVVAGVVAFLRERRRLLHAVLIIAGSGLALLAGLQVMEQKEWLDPWPLLISAVLVGLPLLGYPVLALFLVVNGITMWRKESRSLGNLLSLLMGLGMIVAPLILIWINGQVGQLTPARIFGTALIVFSMGIAAYVGFCFLVFLLASWSYGRIPLKFDARHVIVLGAGLIGDRVPPLLAARLDKGLEVARELGPDSVIIPSGGQGPDELVSEGEAMAAYLQDQGFPAERILVEDKARTTHENLQLSRALMDDPDAPAVVVTTGYHVFRAATLTRLVGMNARVRGARTAAYYVPSAFLREFIAVMRMHLWINVLLVGIWTLLVLWLLIESFRMG